MTSRVSFSKLIISEIKRRIWALVVLFLLFIITGPVMQLIRAENTRMYSTGLDYIQMMEESLRPNWFIVVPVIVLTSVLMGISGFSYLFSKRKVDLYHCLPVKRETIFAVQYISGLIMYGAVTIVNLLLTMAVAASGHYLTGKAFGYLMGAFAGEVVNFLFLYNVSIVAVMLTGTLFTAILGVVVLNVIYPLYSFAISYLETYSFVTKCDMTTTVEKVPYFSPLASLVSYVHKSQMGVNEFNGASERVVFLLFVSICSIVCLIVAFYLNKKRPSEAAGKAIAFGISKPIIRIPVVILGALAGGVLVCANSNKFMSNWIWAGLVFGALITHMVMESIYNSDFKAFLKNWKQLLVCIAVVVCTFIIIMLDITGFDKYIPNRADIVEATFVTNNIDSDISYVEIESVDESGVPELNYLYREAYMKKYIFNNPEIIDRIYDINQYGLTFVDEMKEERKTAGDNPDFSVKDKAVEVGYDDQMQPLTRDDIEIHDEPTDEANVNVEFSVFYKLKNGKEVARKYLVKKDQLFELYSALYNMKEYKKVHFDLYNAYEKGVISSVDVNDIFYDKQMSVVGNETDKFMEIYLGELMDAKFDDIRELPIAMVYPRMKTHYGYSETMSGYYIYPSFTKTLAYMKNLGVNMEYMVSKPDVSKIQSISVAAYDYAFRKDTDVSIYVSNLGYAVDDPHGKEMIEKLCSNADFYGLSWSNSLLYDKEDRVEIQCYFDISGGIQKETVAYLHKGDIPKELINDIIDWAAENGNDF